MLVLASAGQTDDEEFQNFIINCDPYYKRHLQKVPENKHKSSAPEIEEELKTAFELYSKVCESISIIFFLNFVNDYYGNTGFWLEINCIQIKLPYF